MTVNSLVLEILQKLIAFDTTSFQSNLSLVNYVEEYLSCFNCLCERIENDDGTKASLWVTFGPDDRPGYILSGHCDTVPAQNWTGPSYPYHLYQDKDKGRLYGRGTSDMKGFIAACLAQAPLLSQACLQIPIHFAISYDEEIGCVGVRPLLEKLARLSYRPLGCFIGEPTNMQMVIGHKGKHAFHVTVTGMAGHSSRSPEYVNAIEWAAKLIIYIQGLGLELRQSGLSDNLYDIPHSTILTTMVKGGQAMNSVPDHCDLTYEIRMVDNQEGDYIVQKIKNYVYSELEPEMKRCAAEVGIVIHDKVSYPGLNISVEHPLVKLTQYLSGSSSFSKVAFGCEAGLFDQIASIPTVIIGPGSINQAHTTHEFITLSQLEICERFLKNLIEYCEK